MSRVASIISKLDKQLRKNKLTTRDVYLRTTVMIGGDTVLGRGGIVAVNDKLLDPVPAVVEPALVGPYIYSQTLGTTDLGDYLLTISPSAITEAELRKEGVEIVFKDATGEEVFAITGVGSTVLDGQVVTFTVTVKSKIR